MVFSAGTGALESHSAAFNSPLLETAEPVAPTAAFHSSAHTACTFAQGRS